MEIRGKVSKDIAYEGLYVGDFLFCKWLISLNTYNLRIIISNNNGLLLDVKGESFIKHGRDFPECFNECALIGEDLDLVDFISQFTGQ